MHLKIKPFNNLIREMYQNHGHFYKGDAGLDLFITNRKRIGPRETVLIKLGIACENKENKPYLLMPRSSISKTPLRLCNSIGLIDAGYRGELMAVVDNVKDEVYNVELGQRIFQIVAMNGNPISFDLVDELTDSERGQGGFGSTGK